MATHAGCRRSCRTLSILETANYSALDGADLDFVAEAVAAPLSAETEIHVQHMGGAVARVPADQTAFAYRAARYFINVIGATTEFSEYETMRTRVRTFYERILPNASHGQIPNFYGEKRGNPQRNLAMISAQRLAILRRRVCQYLGRELALKS